MHIYFPVHRYICKGESDVLPTQRSWVPIRQLQLSGREQKGLKTLLLKALNRNQLLILSEVAFCGGNSITCILTDMSSRTGIPLSTLKLNANILKEMELIVYDNHPAALTEAGKMTIRLLGYESTGVNWP